jgi:hypothetical protein
MQTNQHKRLEEARAGTVAGESGDRTSANGSGGTVREDYRVGLGASHQTGWTGLVATLIQLFGSVDAKGLLEVGKAAAHVRGTSQVS